MRFKQGYSYKIEVSGELIQLVYFCSTNADKALAQLQGLKFKTVDDLKQWLNTYGKDDCGRFIWLAIDQK